MIARAIMVSLAVSLFGSVPVALAQTDNLQKQQSPVVAAADTPVKQAQQSTNVNKPQPTIEFVRPQSNETLTNYPIHVQLKVTNFELLPPVQYWRPVMSRKDMGKGHIHFSLDDAPALATDETSLIIESNGGRSLPPGRHVLRAELRAMNHKALRPPVVAQTTIIVQPAGQGDRNVSTPTGDPKIAKLRQQVRQMQDQVFQLRGGGQRGLQIGKTAGEANALVNKGKYSEAEAKYKEALAIIPRQLSQKHLTDKSAAVLKAHVLTKMAILYAKKKDYAAADSNFKQATELFDSNPIASPVARKNQVECLRAYAEVLRAENQSDKAKEMDARADKIKV